MLSHSLSTLDQRQVRTTDRLLQQVLYRMIRINQVIIVVMGRGHLLSIRDYEGFCPKVLQS